MPAAAALAAPQRGILFRHSLCARCRCMLMDTYHPGIRFGPNWVRALSELAPRAHRCSPTCMCFDIVDELAFDGKTGERCASDCRTNPRPQRLQAVIISGSSERERVRHRMYHKLIGFKESTAA